MPPKKGKGKKRNSIVPSVKENGDADPLSLPETPADEKQEFVTPADRLEDPLAAAVTNGATSVIPDTAEGSDEKIKDTMAKAEGDETADAWGLGDDKSKVITEEPGKVDDEVPPEFLPRDLDAEREKVGSEEKEVKESIDADTIPPDVIPEEVHTKAEVEPVVEKKDPEEDPAKVDEEKAAPPVDLEVPDTADAKEHIEELAAEQVAPREETPEAKAGEPGLANEEILETVPEAEKAGETAEAAPEVEAAPEGEAALESEKLVEPTAEPELPGRPVMDAPKPATLTSLTSSDRDFTSTRYQSTTSPQFLNKPHEAANHSLDLDDRNMQSSVNNWYKKVSSFADSLNWRPGWEHLEEFGFLTKTLDAPLSQISLPPVQEWFAEKPKDTSVDWDNLDEQSAKYEEFWEWKSKLALSAVCANFACREIFGKTVFALDNKMTKKLGAAMMVFSKEFGDDITATKFRHMTLKLLQESRAFQSATRKQLVFLSQELANVLSPLTSLMPPSEPKTEEEKQQHAHYSPLVLALYEKVLLATLTLHDTIQKDHKYFALFHPVPGVEFDEVTMEEATFDGLGAGKGAVTLVVRPGLARLGLPKGGDPEDIIIVHKALVVREDGLEEATKFFDSPPVEGDAPGPAE
ncbi:hypothetical protein ABW19_dt0200440 [Dactylella cylindrospora]|nr:hypothetical protein ABW19_dt0200440 [Dactylella cylindrospora]